MTLLSVLVHDIGFHRFDMEADDRVPLITRARHRVHLETACRFLEAFLDTCALYPNIYSAVYLFSLPYLAAADVVLGAEELRYAAQAVGRVSGLIDVENVLDVVFKEFCIGK
jgi:tRNA modification GTPase